MKNSYCLMVCITLSCLLTNMFLPVIYYCYLEPFKIDIMVWGVGGGVFSSGYFSIMKVYGPRSKLDHSPTLLALRKFPDKSVT